MKKILGLIMIVLLLCGCSKKENNKDKPSEEKPTIIYNEDLFNMLEYLEYSNYDYEYDINIYDQKYLYNGTKFDNINKGILKKDKIQVNYFKTSDKFYDEKLDKEINNVFSYVNMFYLDFKYLKEKVNDINFKCVMENNYYNCQNQRFIFNFEENIIKSLEIKEENSNYKLFFKNINNVEKINDKYNDFVRFNISYELTNELEIKNNINFYKIKNVKFIINGEELNLEDDITKILEFAIYDIKLPNKITKYIYENNLIILKQNENIYCLNDKYLNEILNKIM